MARVRPRVITQTELPIKVSPLEQFESRVRGVCQWLPSADSSTLFRLAKIAQDYEVGRRLQAQKASRPNRNKTMQALAELAERASLAFSALPQCERSLFSKKLAQELSAGRHEVLLHDLGLAFLELDAGSARAYPDKGPGLSKEIERIDQMVSELANLCMNFPMAGEAVLIELSQYVSLLPPSVGDCDFSSALCRRLSKVAWVASQIMKRERGPESDTVRMRAVIDLKQEFERVGLSATHTASTKEGDQIGGPHSDFGQFVRQFFLALEPEDQQQRGVKDALGYACWPCKRSERGDEIAAQQTQRRDLIVDLLRQAGVTNS